jgi:pimeloyl-ACP methyl ester carboxylesterase
VSSTAFVDIDWDGRKVCVEYQWVGDDSVGRSVVVFLHEGLGSVSMWHDFPQRLCKKIGGRGLVFSRPGYGRSTPRAESEDWAPDFMHRQAHAVLPALLAAVGMNSPYVLFGHRDGGSIVLLQAARFPDRVAGAIVLAP